MHEHDVVFIRDEIGALAYQLESWLLGIDMDRNVAFIRILYDFAPSILKLVCLLVFLGGIAALVQNRFRLMGSIDTDLSAPRRARIGTRKDGGENASTSSTAAPQGGLRDINGIGAKRAGRLEQAGIKSLADLAGLASDTARQQSVADLVRCSQEQLRRWIQEATELLRRDEQ